MIKALALAGLVALAAGPLVASQTEGHETYELLFRDGTLDAVGRETVLVYRREVTNALLPQAAERDSGEIALSIPPAEAAMAQITSRQGDKTRVLGRFPVSVGNPMIMYFYESVIRDMAEAAGGSPFYIRNRVKEALVRPAELENGQAVVDGKTVSTLTVTLKPFAEDPNRGRMRGFGNLELQVVMSEDVPGWYLSLSAVALPADGAEAVYRSALGFERLEAAQ